MLDAYDGESYAVGDAAEAAGLLPERVTARDVVLVKASRGVALEHLVDSLRSELGPAT